MEITAQLLSSLPCIYESPYILIYLWEASDYPSRVVIKVLKSGYADPQEVEHIANEYTITKDIDAAGVRKAYEKSSVDGRPALVLQYVEGQSVREAFVKTRRTLPDNLKAAVSIAEALHVVHSLKIIHRNISSSNIIIDLENYASTIIDFGIATLGGPRTAREEMAEAPEDSLQYISPELTGRINRPIDYRTDLYSFGVVLYEMLTGRLPFESEDAIELVYSHIAKQPQSPREINPEIPQVVSDIVMRLLSKDPEDRYQSAYGLGVDLKKCLELLESTERVEAFELGCEDFSSTLQIPSKLYGREHELQILTEAIDRVGEGASEALLISGSPGVGKTLLACDIQGYVLERGGRFITGRYDPYHRNAPYYALIGAFSELVELVLTQSTEDLARCRSSIIQAVEGNGALLTGIIPRLELIIGPQPPVQELSPAEEQARFHQIFRSFVRAVSLMFRPFVIFIDNLQWADVSSLNLLNSMLAGGDNPYLLFMGAYRDNEVGPTHQLTKMIETLKQQNIPIVMLRLGNLSLESVNRLVSDTLRCDPSYSQPLSELIYQKTGGNALFVVQFLLSLYDEALLSFNFDTRRWEWAVDWIFELDFTDNVITLMTQKIGALPKETQEILSLAACIGDSFSKDDLAAIAEQTIETTSEHLQRAVVEGLLIPLPEPEQQPRESNLFEFLHDRVRQAAYSMLPKKRARVAHYMMGQMLLERTSKEDIQKRVFDIIDHLNEGFQCAKDEQERIKLVELNLIAGRKAMNEAAYHAAIWYLSMGIGMLPADKWERYYALTKQVYAEAIEGEYLSGNSDRSELLASEFLKFVEDPLEKHKVYRILILEYQSAMRHRDMINLVLGFMREIDMPPLPPEEVDENVIQAQMSRFTKNISARPLDELADAPEAVSPIKEAIEITASALVTFWFVYPQALAYEALEAANMTLENGLCAASAFCLAAVGSILCGFESQCDLGYELGEKALEIIERFDNAFIRPQVEFVFYNMIYYWKHPLRDGREQLLQAYYNATAVGNKQWAAYNIEHYCMRGLLAGDSLPNVNEAYNQFAEPFFQLKHEDSYAFFSIPRQVVSNLIGQVDSPYQLEGQFFSESRGLPQLLPAGVGLEYIFKLMLQCIMGDFAGALRLIDTPEAKRYLQTNTGQFQSNIVPFYSVLAYLQNYATASKTDREAYLSEARTALTQLKQWADYQPVNFMPYYCLAAAEMARVSNKTSEAIDLYHRAIATAKAQEFTHIVALSHELIAKFWMERNQEMYAREHLVEAAAAYQAWGAQSKVAQLQTLHPQWLARMPERVAVSPLDVNTVTKAYQAITSEIELDRLLAKIMSIVIENAGAEKGVLVTYQDDRLLVQAKGELQQGTAEVMQGTPIEEYDDTALSIVNYVARTQTPVVLDDAAHDSVYASDKHIAERQVRSVLCLPIIYQTKLSGVLYLENNLATNVFTPDRLELLKALASQVAISIENAGLYADLEKTIKELRLAEEELRKAHAELEQRVIERTAQLEAANAELEAFIYSVSHDLRAPLRSIDGFSHALLEDYYETVDETGQDYLRRVRAAAQRMGLLIDDLLRLSRVTRTEMQYEAVNLSEIAEDKLAELQRNAPERNMEIIVHPNVVAKGDPNLLAIAIENLLGNAWKFTGNEPIGKIEFGTTIMDGKTVYYVRDNGVGFNMDYVNKLFKPFQRLHTDAEFPGTGIGLAIVQRIITRHEGRIWATGEVGWGATFYFSLPD